MQPFASQDFNLWTGLDYLCIIVMFLSAVWTLILTAPIHCRASIAETVMQWHISPNLMRKQTHLNLGQPESEHIVSKCTVFGVEVPLNERFWSRFHSSAQVCNNCQSCDFKPGGLFRRWMCWLQTGVVLCWLLMSRPWSTKDALMWVLRVMWCPDLLCYQPIWLFP